MARGQGNGSGRGAGLGSGRGPGFGPDIKTEMDPIKTKANAQLGKGKAVKTLFKGKLTRGELTVEYEEAWRGGIEHAEDALTNDDIPLGYKRYVRDYFDAIKPK